MAAQTNSFRTAFAAAIAAVFILAVMAGPAAAGIDAQYWVESHAVSQGITRGDRWDASMGVDYHPATAEWPDVSAGVAEFGANRVDSTSSISNTQFFSYAYADASWSDCVTIWDPSSPVGAPLSLELHFNLSGTLLLSSTGEQPENTTIEARAAVSADVKSVDLAVTAHGYNMITDYGDGNVILRKSGDWDLGGSLETPYSYVYYDDIVLPAIVPNGIAFDLVTKVAVATHARLTWTGEGEFPGLGGYDLTSDAGFSHSMIFGIFTDLDGREISELGYLIGSQGPMFGGPIVVPEPATMLLLATGMAVGHIVASIRKAPRRGDGRVAA